MIGGLAVEGVSGAEETVMSGTSGPLKKGEKFMKELKKTFVQ